MRSSDIFLVSVVTRTRSFLLGAVADLVDQVVDLALGRLDDHLGVDQPGRPDDLLDHVAADLGQLVVARGRGQVDRLADPVEELLPAQRPVVHRARQPEAVVDQVALAGHVAFVHPADLRDGDVRLVDDEQEVLGEVVEQAVRGRAAAAAVDVHRVVLDAGAGPDLAHHLDVVRRAHPQPLRLQQLALLLEARRAGPRARARCRGSRAPSARGRRRSGSRGRRTARSSSVTTSPVSGCSVISRSISSPKNSTRIASSS